MATPLRTYLDQAWVNHLRAELRRKPAAHITILDFLRDVAIDRRGRASRGRKHGHSAGPVRGNDARPERRQAPGRDRLLGMTSEGAPQAWEGGRASVSRRQTGDRAGDAGHSICD